MYSGHLLGCPQGQMMASNWLHHSLAVEAEGHWDHCSNTHCQDGTSGSLASFKLFLKVQHKETSSPYRTVKYWILIQEDVVHHYSRKKHKFPVCKYLVEIIKIRFKNVLVRETYSNVFETEKKILNILLFIIDVLLSVYISI